MNCKEGDLAIVVQSVCGNEGKIVRCVEFMGKQDWLEYDGTIYESDTWLVDVLIPDKLRELAPYLEDEQLRPIRDNPGEDETLTWAPRKEPVPA